MTDNYDDIINLPHPVSKTHPPMPLINRAAQFAPFSALNGHNDAIRETARLTDSRPEIDEELAGELSRKLNYIIAHPADAPVVTITHFVPDAKKAGGSYRQISGIVRKFDEYAQTITLSSSNDKPLRNETIIPLATIVDIAGKCFDKI
jgi:hypothetical protein